GQWLEFRRVLFRSVCRLARTRAWASAGPDTAARVDNACAVVLCKQPLRQKRRHQLDPGLLKPFLIMPPPLNLHSVDDLDVFDCMQRQKRAVDIPINLAATIPKNVDSLAQLL